MQFTRRLSLLLVCLLTATYTQAKEPLNVLFLSVDDLKPTIGAYGDTLAKTPNMDRLAGQGTVMLNNYCQQAVCAPSRMSMFTGLRPDSTKIWDLRTQIQDSNPDAVTMQQWFIKHGYASAGSGKVMHGARNEHPESWTVPFVSKKELPYAEGYPVPAHDNAFYQGETPQRVFREMEAAGIKNWKERNDYMATNGGSPSMEFLDIPDDAYADGALANWAIQQLEDFAKSKEPFFLTVGFMKPHLPFVAPKKYWDMYDHDDFELAAFREQAKDSPDFAYHKYGELRSYSDISRDWKVSIDDKTSLELIHGYYACTSYIDAQIGRVLDKLDSLGLADNTIVVLWGDHGWHLGDHDMWCKHSNFEQATKAPLIISAPGYRPGRTEGMTEFVDIFPTLLELADIQAPYAMEGASLVPLMKDPGAKVKEFSISQYPRGGGRMGYALRNERYRYVVWMKGDWTSTLPYNASLVDAIELYDYQNDPLETVNQANNPQFQSVVEELNKQMLGYFKTYEQAPQQSTDYQEPGQTPGTDAKVIDVATVPTSSLEARFASVSREGDALIFNFENSPKWPSVDFLAQDDRPWDLSGYQAIDVSLTNLSDRPVRTTVYVANPEDSNATKHRAGTRSDIPAGGTETIRIQFAESEYPIDPSRLSSMRIFVDKLTAPVSLQVNRITAAEPGSRATKPAPAPKPSVAPVPTSASGSIKPEANGEIFDLAQVENLNVGLRFTEMKPVADGLMLNFELSPKWPSIEFHPKQGAWDLSGYNTVELVITNEGDQKVKTFAFVASIGDSHQDQKRAQTKTDLAPGESQTLQIPLSSATATFDPRQVDQVRIFVGMHQAPVQLKLSSVKAL